MIALFPSSELLGYDHVSYGTSIWINRLVADSAEWFASARIGLLSFRKPNP